MWLNVADPAEASEKTASPMQKLVMIARCQRGKSSGESAQKPMVRPMKYPPTKFATSAPAGMLGNKALSFDPKILRSHPPNDALMAMATNVLTKLTNSLPL
ncbi:hypothetical protein DENIT_13010 [Pseudomonas veronii]|nr:hypothetical protein DENIT_13010 [Pseudomonas veronii]